MLDVGADQRYNAGGLGEHKEPQQHRTEAPKPSQREHAQSHHPASLPDDTQRSKPVRDVKPREMARNSVRRLHGERSEALYP
jgi:hypothetical protein